MRDRVVRHAGIDRLIHWLMAVCVLLLLATAFLPILGIDFAWVVLHWSTGFVLAALVLVHLVRSLAPAKLKRIWIGPRDIAEALSIVGRTLKRDPTPRPRPGKFSFAQKFIHLAFAVVVLAAIVTGALMMVKIDTPWWDRNPFWLTDPTWGVVYVLHGLSALLLITMVMTHIYFALRPEKLMFFRSMITGSLTRDEYERHHDPDRWPLDR